MYKYVSKKAFKLSHWKTIVFRYCSLKFSIINRFLVLVWFIQFFLFFFTELIIFSIPNPYKNDLAFLDLTSVEEPVHLLGQIDPA